jgi:hypothetical protein
MRFKLNFQVENSQVFLWMVRVSIGGQSWRARCVWNELRGHVFIAFGIDNCTLEILLNLAMSCTSLHGRVQAHEAIQFDPIPTLLKFKWCLNGKAMQCEVLDIWFFHLM